MELDKEILEKICHDRHNSGSKHPVPVSLLHYEVIVDSARNVWVSKCIYSIPMNVNGIPIKEGWSYNSTEFVNKSKYEEVKTRSTRESKLKELGI